MLVCDRIEVVEDFALFRIAFRPLPVLEHVHVKGVGIDRRFRIDPAPGIPVPVPCAANTTGIIKRLRIQPHLIARPVEGIKTTNTGTNDCDVEFKAVQAI